MKMTCDYCKGRVEFPSGSQGEVAKCPHCNSTIRLTPENGKPVKEENDPLVTLITIGLGTGVVGIGITVYYFFFYPITNPGLDVVNSARLHYLLCGVIIGTGLTIIGTLITMAGMLMSQFTLFAQSVYRGFGLYTPKKE